MSSLNCGCKFKDFCIVNLNVITLQYDETYIFGIMPDGSNTCSSIA